MKSKITVPILIAALAMFSATGSAQTNIPASHAVTLQPPVIAGYGVLVEVFTNYGGGAPPTPAALEGRVPEVTTFAPKVNFYRAANVSGPGSLDDFLAESTVLPLALRGLNVSNFTVRVTAMLKVTPDLDLDTATTPIDVMLGATCAGGLRLSVGDVVLTNLYSTTSQAFLIPVAFERAGLYPVTMLFAAEGNRLAQLSLRWQRGSYVAAAVQQQDLFPRWTPADRVVTFDESNIGLRLTNQFMSQGIQFRTVSGDLQVTRAKPTEFVPVTASSVYADPATNPAAPGELEFWFVQPGTTNASTTRFVEFFVIDADTNGATVTAYDPGSTVIFSQAYHGGVAARERVSIEHPQIARVRVTLGVGSDTAAMDNLSYRTPEDAPDLVVDQLQAPAVVTVGQPFQASWRVRNVGKAPSGGVGWWDGLSLSGDAVVGNDEVLSSTRLLFRGAFPAGASLIHTQQVTLTLSQQGLRYLVANVDLYDNVVETNEWNNDFIAAVPIEVRSPMLALVATEAPAAALLGETIPVSWTFQNVGTAPVPAGAQWTDHVYLSTNATGAASTRLLLQDVTLTNALAIGATRVVTASVTIPLRSDQPVGSYVLEFRHVNTAYNLTNQSLRRAITLTTPPLPDLAVTALTVPANVEASVPVTLRWTVTNQSDYAAPGPWTEAVYLSTDNQAGGDTLVESSQFTGGLAPHSWVERVETVLVPPTQAGQRWFVVTADSEDVLPETGAASNNTRVASAPTTVTAADLAVENLVVPASAVFGSTIPVAWTVRNRGTVSAQASWTEQLILWNGNQPGVSFHAIQIASSARVSSLAPGASYRRTNQVTLPLFSSYSNMNLVIKLTVDPNSYQPDSNRTNNVTNSPPIAFTLPQLSDLAVLDVRCPSNAVPSEVVRVFWTVTNRGPAAAVAPWREAVSWSDDTSLGNDRSLGTFVINAPLAAGSSVVRMQQVTVPSDAASGLHWFIVHVDSSTDIVETTETNNVKVAAQPISIGTVLGLALNKSLVPENAGTNAVTATLTRNAGLATNLIVSLSNSHPEAITAPATVMISAGRASATFAVGTVWDHAVDGSQVVTLTASAAGFPETAATLTVTDSDKAMLSFQVPPVLPEGAGGVGLLLRNTGTNEPLTVQLWSEDPWRLRVTNRVVIPAGQLAGWFEMLADENDLFEGDAHVRLMAVATNYAPISVAVTVSDNEITTLALSVADTTVSEGTTGPATVGTVTRTLVTAQSLRVNFLVEPDSPLARLSEVVIPAGEASARFNIYVRDDNLVNGTRAATITARPVTARGDVVFTNTSTVTLQVLDNDGPSLELAISRGVIAENGSASAKVSRNTAPTGDLVVTLSSSDTSEATVPSSVTIPNGQTEAAFLVTGVTDGASDGVQTASLSASAAGYNSAVASLNVSDNDLPDLVMGFVVPPSNALTGESITLTWTVTNLGLTAASGSWVDHVYVSCSTGCREATMTARASFSGTLAVGEGYVRSARYVVPSEPGSYQIRVVTDAEYALAEGSERNNEWRGSSTAVAAYRALAWTDATAVPNGTPIPIQGRAWLTRDTNSPAAFKPVKVDITVKRMRRTLTATTDALGNFQTVFTPLPTEAGAYTLGADYPSKTPAPIQDQFLILGLSASPDKLTVRLVPNTPLGGTITLRNLSDLPLTGLGAVAVGAPADLQAEFSVTNNLPGDGTAALAYTFTTTRSNAATFEFQIHAQTGEGVFVDVPMKATVVPFRPDLFSTPPYLERGMVRGQQAVLSFELANNGGAPTGPLTVQLPALSWLSLASEAAIPSLNPGEKTVVTLRLAPPDDLPLTRYDGNLVVAGPGAWLSVPFQFRAVSTSEGDLHVRVEDQYTYYVEGAPLVTNATVTLLDPFNNTVVAETNTAQTGEVTFFNLPEGHYTIEVAAARHAMYRSTLVIQPGILNEFRVFQRRETVTYTWRVVPTEIEDHYRMVLESQFEADVPVPNVVVENPLIFPFVTRGKETQIEIRLRNEGLIAAHDVKLTETSHPYYEVIPLVRLISVMPAKSRMTIPAIIRQRGTEPSRGHAATKGGIPPCPGDGDQCMPSFVQPVTYYYECGADGIMDRRAIDMKALCNESEAGDCVKAIVGAVGDLDPCGAVSAALSCLPNPPGPCATCAIQAACGDPGDCVECLCRAVAEYMDFSGDPGNATGPGGAPPGGPPGGTSGWSFPGDRGDCLGAGGGSGGSAKSTRRTTKDGEPMGVCARVRIRIEQEAVLTRAAFLGTLAIENYGSATLGGIRVDLDFRDEAGNPAGDKFAVRGPQCTGLSDVAGGGRVPAGTTGSALYTFVPTRDAAPNAPAVFRIGGTLRYTEGGQEIVVPLLPSSIVVLPEPRLVLQYFQQRDVFSDDPFTEEVEPAEPFALGLIAKNIGAATARNFRITSAQPKIVENEKGLLIDFKIIGTQVGSNAAIASLTADLGNIGPGKSQVARWLLTSTLQGKFIDYSATFEQVDRYGCTNMSLIENVEIHELIKSVLADRPGDDLVPDFLVNDDPDPNDQPDTLYLSDGTVAIVNLASNPAADGAVHAGDFEVHLTASMTTGWNYFNLPDPGARFFLYRAVRSDGKELRVGDNVWQTDRTFPSYTYGVEREWRLHLLDFDGTGSYTLYYRVDDTVAPSIVEVLSPQPVLQLGPVSQVDVVFSEPIDLATFNDQDVMLTLNGGENLAAGVATVTLVSNATYRISGLTAITGGDGNYELTIVGGGIQDYGGNAVQNSAGARWAKGTAVPVLVTVGPVLPKLRPSSVPTVDVVFSRAINAATFDWTDLTLTLNSGANLANSSVTITPLSATTFRIGGLGSLTAADGIYTLTVRAGGLQDTGAVAGVGFLTETWTKDSAGPVIVSLEGIATDPRSIVVISLDVAFSEAIDPASFDWQDLTLRRNDGVNLINSDVTVTPLTAATFRLANFNWMVGYEGRYTLSVNAAGIADLAGNPGSGLAERSWVMDTTPPSMPLNLSITPDTGASSTDGLINTNQLVISGRVNETNATVRVYDTTTSHDLGEATVASNAFRHAIELSGLGNHRLRVRAVDEAANVSSNAFFDVFVDLSAPLVTLDPVTPNPRTNSVASQTVRFSEAIDPATFDWTDLALTFNGATHNLITSNAITIVLVQSNVFRVDGLGVLTAAVGSYELVVNADGIRDLAGNAGGTSATNTWQLWGANAPPRLASVGNQSVAEGNRLSFTLGGTDTNDPPQQLTFSFVGTVPTGASLGAQSGAFSWRPTEAQGPGNYPFTVRVTDNGLPPLSDTASFDVWVDEINQPPVITPVSDLTVFESFTLSHSISASDADLPANPLTFALASNAPSGMVLGPLDGVLRWTPNETQCDTTNRFTIFVTDHATPSLSCTSLVTVVARRLKEGLNLPRRATPAGWEFTFKGVPGKSYRLEGSQDIATWILIRIFAAEGRYSTVNDPDPTERTHRFYRAVEAQ